jgi:formate/nitrite transporter FocA (FNT family)
MFWSKIGSWFIRKKDSLRLFLLYYFYGCIFFGGFFFVFIILKVRKCLKKVIEILKKMHPERKKGSSIWRRFFLQAFIAGIFVAAALLLL